MKTAWIKYARTFVPALAGFILTALAGVDIEVDSAALETVLDGLVVGVASLIYYGAVNLVSRIKPELQFLNGAAATPLYADRQTYDEVIAGLTKR